MIPAIQSGAIAASIHQQPYVQGQLSVRTLVEHLLHEAELPFAQYLNPSIILRSNLHLFREANGVSSNRKPIPPTTTAMPLRFDALRRQ